MLAHRSGWPLFRMAKDGLGNLTTNVSKYEESENQVHQGQNDTRGSKKWPVQSVTDKTGCLL